MLSLFFLSIILKAFSHYHVLYSSRYCIVPSFVIYLYQDERNNMKIDNTKAQMRKGLLELCVLSIISDKEMYPSDIISKLKDLEMIVVEGTLYPMLTRLKNVGLLQYAWKESKSGPPRKYYKITDEGIAVREELVKTWQKLSGAVNASIKES